MSYYVLFARHSVVNAVLFLGVLLPALFCYIFPVFALAGARPGTAWYLVHWLAHLAMAGTAWAMPAFWARLPHLRHGRRGAGPVHVTGRLTHSAVVVAWCTGYLATLPTPNPVRDTAAFTAALHRLDHVDVPVTCHGPPPPPGTGSVDVTWTLDTTLKGDREQR